MKVMDVTEENIASLHSAKTLTELPQSYTNVPPLVLAKKDAPIPKVGGPVKIDGQVINQTLQEDNGLV